MATPPQFTPSYPEALAKNERGLVEKRRTAAGVTGTTDIGIAVSGGGIRSATFALGFFQALASKHNDLLRHVDFLSTVSGGSYFGGFLGGLFLPRAKPKGATKPRIEPASPDTVREGLAGTSHPIGWLRDNGRYLSPNGSGDTVVAVSTYLRNLFALHIVLGTFLLAVMLLFFTVRGILWQPEVEAWFLDHVASGMWWSPYVLLPAAWFLIVVAPTGFAFWFMPGLDTSYRVSILPYLVLGLVFAGGPIAIAHGGLSVWATCALLGASGIAFLTFVVAIGVLLRGRRKADGHRGRWTRNRLSTYLGTAVTIGLVLAAVALVDSFGQTLYAVLVRGGGGSSSIWRVLAAAVPVLPVVIRQLVARFGASPERTAVRIPVMLLAGIAAMVVVVVHLTAISTLAHAIGWGGDIPLGNPGRTIVAAARAPEPKQPKDPCAEPAPPPICRVATGTATAPHTKTALVGLGLALIVSLVLGWCINFLNLSSVQAFYGSRLTRAYLGASNGVRTEGDSVNRRITETVPGDAITLADYNPHARGGPLHLVNVTINETVEGESQVEQRDRKGIGMAIGPAGVSAGVSHHAVWSDGTRAVLQSAAPASGRFDMFSADGRGTPVPVEQLDLGSWIGISGAAVGTGFGYQTSIALTLLLGLFNIRLGYWWDSGVDPGSRTARTDPGITGRLGECFAWAFPVQAYLIDELLARLHGPGRRRWPLSDGGHFENTGCYELIRRRIPRVIVLDDGCDPDGDFADLGNLVRKARADFGAEITFDQTAAQPELFRGLDLAKRVGKLEDLRAKGGKRPMGFRLAEAHAALGHIRHANGERSLLLLVKPTLVGDEPADVTEYKVSNPEFPQETTADQFFNEAQWESYRMLGEHIGNRLAPVIGRLFGRLPAA